MCVVTKHKGCFEASAIFTNGLQSKLDSANTFKIMSVLEAMSLISKQWKS